jgi:DNA polymerase III gamma/tau subunit
LTFSGSGHFSRKDRRDGRRRLSDRAALEVQGFAELVGQEHVFWTLGSVIEGGLLAAAINADPEAALQTDPEKLSVRSILEGNCIDVIEIDGAWNNSVDQIPALREECRHPDKE